MCRSVVAGGENEEWDNEGWDRVMKACGMRRLLPVAGSFAVYRVLMVDLAALTTRERLDLASVTSVLPSLCWIGNFRSLPGYFTSLIRECAAFQHQLKPKLCVVHQAGAGFSWVPADVRRLGILGGSSESFGFRLDEPKRELH